MADETFWLHLPGIGLSAQRRMEQQVVSDLQFGSGADQAVASVVAGALFERGTLPPGIGLDRDMESWCLDMDDYMRPYVSI
jgi:hypothetical protein